MWLLKGSRRDPVNYINVNPLVVISYYGFERCTIGGNWIKDLSVLFFAIAGKSIMISK